MPAETPPPGRQPPAQWLQLLAVTVAALASLATSKGADVRRRYPVWEVARVPAGKPPGQRAGWARTETTAFERRARSHLVAGWISRSGKEGLGLTLEVTGPAARSLSTVDLREARLELGGQQIQGTWRPFQPAPAATGAARQYLYVAFPFDNNRAWNQGVRRGLLHLQVVLGGSPLEPWSIPLVQEDRGDSELVPLPHQREQQRRQQQLERERRPLPAPSGEPRGPSALQPIDAGVAR